MSGIERPVEEEHSVATLTLIHTEVQRRLQDQRDSSSKIDTKAAVMIPLIALTAPLGVWEHWSWWILPGRCLILGALFLLLLTLRVRARWAVPVPRELATNYSYASEENLLWSLVCTKVEAFEMNASAVSEKARYWRLSALLMVVAVPAILVAYAIEGW